MESFLDHGSGRPGACQTATSRVIRSLPRRSGDSNQLMCGYLNKARAQQSRLCGLKPQGSDAASALIEVLAEGYEPKTAPAKFGGEPSTGSTW